MVYIGAESVLLHLNNHIEFATNITSILDALYVFPMQHLQLVQCMLDFNDYLKSRQCWLHYIGSCFSDATVYHFAIGLNAYLILMGTLNIH